MSVPYPKDKNNVKAKIDTDQKEAVRDIGFVKVYFSITNNHVNTYTKFVFIPEKCNLTQANLTAEWLSGMGHLDHV